MRKELTQKEWELLLTNYNSTGEELFSKFGFKLNYQEKKNILFQLNRNTENFYNKFHALLWQFPCNMSHDEWESLLTALLYERDHDEHENIVGVFQVDYKFNKSNIEVLKYIYFNPPEKFKQGPDILVPFLRKIIYAIGAQPYPESLNALKQLLYKTNNEKVLALLTHQIKYLKQKNKIA